jgi:hypothetical protein
VPLFGLSFNGELVRWLGAVIDASQNPGGETIKAPRQITGASAEMLTQ